MPSLLDAVRVVLYEPQKPINIAATVRAMKNMGVAELRLVRPCAYEANFIEVIAHHTRDIAERIQHFDTLDAALADCVRVGAFTGRRRAAKWPMKTPREAAADLAEYAPDGPVGVLFGREDDGLPADAIDRAHFGVTIPTTAHASLNVSQAVLVGLYELHLAAGDATVPLGRPRRHAGPPTTAQLEEFFGDAERALATLDFFRTRSVEHVTRGVRSLAFRAAPDERELGLLRAMAFEVIRTVERERSRAYDAGYAAGLEAGRAAAGPDDARSAEAAPPATSPAEA